MNKFPMSFSRLSTFETCPMKFEYMYVLKSVEDESNVYSEYGQRVHTALEMYGRTGDVAHLTDESRKYKSTVDLLRGKRGTKLWEQQMAIDANGTPCDWFSPDVWLRGIVDAMVADLPLAVVVDWKTGKVKHDYTQLDMFAMFTFAHYPEVQEVKAAYAWLKDNSAAGTSYTRDSVVKPWGAVRKRLDVVQDAVELGVFPAKPGWMCKYCPAKKVCPYA